MSDTDTCIISTEKFAHYIERFNNLYPEDIVNAIPDWEAWGWMQHNIPFLDCFDSKNGSTSVWTAHVIAAIWSRLCGIGLGGAMEIKDFMYMWIRKSVTRRTTRSAWRLNCDIPNCD
jgi:hypothetical protein